MEGTRWAFANVIVILCMVIPFTSGIHAVISTPSLYNTTATGTSGNEDRMNIVVGFNMTLDRTFTEELNNSSSREYINLEEEMRKTLSDIFSEMQGFHGAVVNNFMEGSVVGDFDLLFDGDSNLTMLQDEFAERLDSLEHATIDGSNVTINAFEMKANFKKAAQKQIAGTICEIATCNKGYVCQNGKFSCIHVCTFLDEICSDRGGCLYDPVADKPTCRCTEGALFSENKCQYQQSDGSAELLGKSIGGAIAGVVGVIFISVIGYILKKVCTCEPAKTNDGSRTGSSTCTVKISCKNIYWCSGQVVNYDPKQVQSPTSATDAVNPPPPYEVNDPIQPKIEMSSTQTDVPKTEISSTQTSVSDKSEAGMHLKIKKNDNCVGEQNSESDDGVNKVVWFGNCPTYRIRASDSQF